MTLGEKVKALRENANISQGELGLKTQMTQRKISYIENDRYEPSVADIRELCLFFKVSSDYLVGLPKGLTHPDR